MAMARDLKAANLQIKALKAEVKELQKLTLDGLTGLMQRRVFQGLVEKEILRCKRTEKPFSLFVIDLNYLKTVNDRHGHPAGDAMLVAFAKLLAQSLREGDVLARTGGDEFMVFLPDENAKHALTVKTKLLNKFEREKESLPFFFGAAIGISSFGEGHQNFEELYTAADKAMYEHKQEMKKYS